LALLEAQRGESDLCLIDGAFYLFATCEVEEPVPADVEKLFGVDLDIVTIATDSDGETYSHSRRDLNIYNAVWL
jgi:putative transposase